ncbi:MAG: hypothetical protein OIF40_06705 [Mangrovicoccus sp.]|nr:hypothetical protein [Mangrovicoccus sp.]
MAGAHWRLSWIATPARYWGGICPDPAGSRERLSKILTDLAPDLAKRPEQLTTLCRFIIALHEGGLTQLGLEPELQSGPSLLSQFVPMAIGALRAPQARPTAQSAG